MAFSHALSIEAWELIYESKTRPTGSYHGKESDEKLELIYLILVAIGELRLTAKWESPPHTDINDFLTSRNLLISSLVSAWYVHRVIKDKQESVQEGFIRLAFFGNLSVNA